MKTLLTAILTFWIGVAFAMSMGSARNYNTLLLSELNKAEQELVLDAVQIFEGWKKGSRSYRNNNPGNLEYNKYTKAYGATGTDGRFAKFPSYHTGRNALRIILFKTKTYPTLTIKQAIHRYAPNHENDSDRYAAFIIDYLKEN